MLVCRIGKADRNRCPPADPALQAELCTVELDSVLHDRQAQAGSADGLGVALIHPVETLKDPLLLSGRDADTAILNP